MQEPWYKQIKFNAHEKAATEAVAESTHQLFYCPADVRILIIDDEAAICQVIERALAQPHFAIDSVSQHDKIDAALKAQTYSLIIMDYVLPGMDANALFDLVKNNQPDASVIVMTGYPSVDSSLEQLASPGLRLHHQTFRHQQTSRHGAPLSRIEGHPSHVGRCSS